MERNTVAAVIAAAAIAAAGVVFTQCHPDPTPIAPALASKLEQHAIASAVDTSEVSRLRRVAAVADSAKRSALRKAAAIAESAKREHDRADSLADLAAAATSAQDSATFYHGAYNARTAENATLQRELAQKDAALLHGDQQVAPLDTALTRSENRAKRADEVISTAVDELHRSDPPCRVLRLFRCPSRKAAMIGGVALGASAAIVTYRQVR